MVEISSDEEGQYNPPKPAFIQPKQQNTVRVTEQILSPGINKIK